MYGGGRAEAPTDAGADPVKNTKSVLEVPVADPKYAPSSAARQSGARADALLGSEQIWDTQVNAHNPMMDQYGRVIGPRQTRSPSSRRITASAVALRSAQLYPLAGTPEGSSERDARSRSTIQSSRNFTTSIPASARIPHFAEDANNTLAEQQYAGQSRRGAAQHEDVLRDRRPRRSRRLDGR